MGECPSHTYPANGTCARCSPDCLTCSGPGASSCVDCPASRPFLQRGRCLPYCPRKTYAAGSECKPCDESCADCTSGSSCTGCRRGHVLKAGICVAVTCPFADTFGMCLSGFIDRGTDCTTSTNQPPPSTASQSKSQNAGPSLAPLAVLAALPLLLFLVWYIRRQRRETRERTAEFASQLDNREVGKRLDALAAEEELEGRKRRGLRELWLKNKARVARPRSRDIEQSSCDRSAPTQTPTRSESVRMQDFSKRCSYEDIGQDPGPTPPTGGLSYQHSADAGRPSSDGPSVTTPALAPSTGPPEAPKASLDLTHLWPNLALRPNAL